MYHYKKQGYRDFTCSCASLTAKVLFLDLDIAIPIIRMQEEATIVQLFKERRLIINKNLEQLSHVNNQISGSIKTPLDPTEQRRVETMPSQLSVSPSLNTQTNDLHQTLHQSSQQRNTQNQTMMLTYTKDSFFIGSKENIPSKKYN